MNTTEKPKNYARVWAEVDLDAILSNMEQMKANLAEGTKLMAVIKTDGYGHGSVPVARVLEPLSYLYGFATATFEEAMILRKSGVKKPVLILGYSFPYCYSEMIRQEIRGTLFLPDQAQALSEAACRVQKEAIVHIKVDTGMSRIGIRPDDSGLALIEEVMHRYPGIRIEGIFTHFAKADETDKSAALGQYERFLAFTRRVERVLGLSSLLRHCCNSAGIIRLPETGMDMARAGISLYGLWPSDEVERDVISLRPALSLKSHIIYIKEVEPGTQISYGGTYTAADIVRVATIPVWYGDGYPRSLSGRGYVLIHGKRAQILGRVCMDQMMVDVTGIPEAAEGDVVVLLGEDETERMTAEMLGDLSGRFNYELVCDINKRVPRVYLQGGSITATKDYYEDFEYLPEKGQ